MELRFTTAKENLTTKLTKSTKTILTSCFFVPFVVYFQSKLFHHRCRVAGLLLVLGAVIYIGGAVWGPALLDDADSVHAEAAREMVQRGGFITLYADGIRYLEKAPLMYWAIAVGFRSFGASEPAARLPLALATIALILLTASFARWAFGQRAGLYAGLIIGTSAGIYLFTRILIPDVLVALWLVAGIYCFVRALERIEQGGKGGGWLFGLYGSAALAVLTKGLIGAVFPGAIIGLFLLGTNRLRLIAKLAPISGTALFLAIAAPWHLLAGFENPGFFWFYFVNEHFLRYLGKRYPVDYDKVPLLAFYGLHFVWLFPWSSFLPLYRWRAREAEQGDRARVARWLLLIWPAVIILFFSFSTRQEYYTLPALPAFAILLGQALANAESATAGSALRRWLNWVRGGLFIASILGVIGVGVLLFATLNIAVDGDIASVLTRNPGYYALSLGHIFDLTPQSSAALRWPLIGAAAVFLFGSAASFWLGRRGRHMGANVAIALMMAGFFACSQQAMLVFEPYLSSRTFALTIKKCYQPGDQIIINGDYESGSSINFYTELPVLMVNGRTADLEFGSYYPDAPKRFLDNEELVRYWDGVGRVFLVTEEDKAAKVRAALGPRPLYELKSSGGKYLYSNLPPSCEHQLATVKLQQVDKKTAK